jgi:hypothetical protein
MVVPGPTAWSRIEQAEPHGLPLYLLGLRHPFGRLRSVKPSPRQWLMISLAFWATVINYMDRQALSGGRAGFERPVPP